MYTHIPLRDLFSVLFRIYSEIELFGQMVYAFYILIDTAKFLSAMNMPVEW